MSFRVHRRTINFRGPNQFGHPVSVPSLLLGGRNCELTAREMGCAAWGRHFQPVDLTHPETSFLAPTECDSRGEAQLLTQTKLFLSLSVAFKIESWVRHNIPWSELPPPQELLTGSGTGDKTTHNWPHPRPTNAWDRGDNALHRPVDWQNTFQISAKTPKTE